MKKIFVFVCTMFVSISAWAVTCSAGQYLPAGEAECAQCLAGHSCSGGTYSFSTTVDQGITTCPGGKYTAAGASSCSNVSAGYFCSGGCKTATPTSDSDCLTGNTCGRCTTDSETGRPAYTDAGGGAASCSVCPAVTDEFANRVEGNIGYYPSSLHGYGVARCYAHFVGSDEDATFYTVCYYSSSSGNYTDSSNCQTFAPTACVAGKYNTITSTSEWLGQYAGCKGVDCMKGKVCTDTDAGYYSAEGDLTQTACPTGTYSTGGVASCTSCPAGNFAPTGSAVCYPHILHVGNDVVYLKSTKQTTPSLNLRIGNDVFYANMITERTRMSKDSSHYLHVKTADNVHYYVCDDTTCPQ